MSTAAAQGPVETGELPSGEEIAREVTEQLKGQLEQSELDSLVTLLRERHRIDIPATATIDSFTDTGLLKFIVVADPDPKHNEYADLKFTGTAESSVPDKDASGTYRGHLITNNFERLLAKTTAFWYRVSNDNLKIGFSDGSMHTLGLFYGRRLTSSGSPGLGIGRGSGSWSRDDSHGHNTHASN